MSRHNALESWLADTLGHRDFSLAPASADASFRSYFRVALPDGGSRIAMDAPPDLEDSAPFVRIAGLLAQAGVHAPTIFAADLKQGFLLLEDLGSTHYQDVLDDATCRPLYVDALDALVRMQRIDSLEGLPVFDAAFLRREMDLFDEWYIGRHLNATLTDAEKTGLAQVKDALIAAMLGQPQGFMHRDYHCRNLMQADPNPGVIDFQGAVVGPLAYDVASLLKDCYVVWPEETVLDLAIRYWEKARKADVPVAADIDTFYRDLEFCGVQRHLKVLGLFARLNHRDNKPQYLDDLPTVFDYVLRAARRYRDLAPLAKLLMRLSDQAPQVGYTF